MLLFDELRTSKLADLGRAAARGEDFPHYDCLPAGDRGYAPPEMLYDAPIGSWQARRMGCDAYHLGSMISSLFTTVGMTPLLMMSLEPNLRWTHWRGDYETALTFLRPAFSEAVGYVAEEIPAAYRGRLIRALSELCEPDPSLRGDPRERAGAIPYALHRYLSLFDLLASQAEIRFTRSN